jgi:hypothetical protein
LKPIPSGNHIGYLRTDRVKTIFTRQNLASRQLSTTNEFPGSTRLPGIAGFLQAIVGNESCTKSREGDWDRIWLEEYRQFLRLAPGDAFTIEISQVINFLIEIKSRGKKAWQRMQALKAIKSSAERDLRLSTNHLDEVTSKLQYLVDQVPRVAASPQPWAVTYPTPLA